MCVSVVLRVARHNTTIYQRHHQINNLPSSSAQKSSPVRPGNRVWMWPDTASSETPDSIHAIPSSLQAWLMAVRAP